MEMLMALSQAESSRDVPLDGQHQQMPGKASDDPRDSWGSLEFGTAPPCLMLVEPARCLGPAN